MAKETEPEKSKQITTQLKIEGVKMQMQLCLILKNSLAI